MTPEEYLVSMYGNNTEFDCWVTGEKTSIDWNLQYQEAKISYTAYLDLWRESIRRALWEGDYDF